MSSFFITVHVQTSSPDELLLDERQVVQLRQQPRQVVRHQARLVVGGRAERGHRRAPDVPVRILDQVQKVRDRLLDVRVDCLRSLDDGELEGSHDSGAGEGRTVLGVLLQLERNMGLLLVKERGCF
jgi:hypothetical protein